MKPAPQRRTKAHREASQPRQGEVQMKVWVSDTAERLKTSPSAIWMRLYRGKLNPPLRRINARLIYVKP
jgi:hypothetical protein